MSGHVLCQRTKKKIEFRLPRNTTTPGRGTTQGRDRLLSSVLRLGGSPDDDGESPVELGPDVGQDLLGVFQDLLSLLSHRWGPGE